MNYNGILDWEIERERGAEGYGMKLYQNSIVGAGEGSGMTELD